MLKKNTTVLIAGDSWSAGEWDHVSGLTHLGLAQYLFQDGYSVVNLGQPGGWNGLTVSKLETFLKLNQFALEQISHIFVFQTEWIRDLLHNSDTFSMYDTTDHNVDYFLLKSRIISRFYSRLSNLATLYNKKIYLVGGVSDTMWLDRFLQEYPNLEIACQSFTNLLTNQTHRIDIPTFALFNSQHIKNISQLKQAYIDKDANLLLDDIDLGTSRLSLFSEHKEFFWPDGTHPNRRAHNILFNYLKDNKLV